VSITRRVIRAGDSTRVGIMGLTQLGRKFTCTTSGTTTTIIAGRDSANKATANLATYGENFEEGCPVRMIPVASPGEGEESFVTKFDRTTGTLTVSPAFSLPGITIRTSDISAEQGEVWHLPVRAVGDVDIAINEALTRFCHYWKLTPLSMLADSDCQANTGWSVSAGTKNTVLAPQAFTFPFKFGRYFLDWFATTANDYFYQAIPVSENRQWHVAVLMRTAAATTATVTIRDLANSANITTSGDTLSVTGLQSSGSDWQFLKASFTVPDNCDRVEIRINNNTTSGRTYVAMAAMWPNDTSRLPLPTRVSGEAQVGQVFRVTERLDIDSPESWTRNPYPHAVPTHDSYLGVAVRFDRTVGSDLFLCEEQAFYDALTTDATAATNTTDCPDDYVTYAAAWRLLHNIAQRMRTERGDKEAASWLARTAELKRDADRVAKRFVRPRRIVTRLMR